MKKIKFIILSLFLIVHLSCYTQIDSTYIEPFEHNFSLMFFTANKFNALSHQHLSEFSKFRPNRPWSLGVAFVGEKIGLKLGYGFKFLRNNDKGDTRSLDLQYHYYGSRFLIDVIGQRYKGYYTNSDDKNEIDIFDDIKTLKAGIFGQYVFNSERFSYRAAFNQHDMQIKTAGSFLFGGGIYFSQIDADISYFFEDSTNHRTKLTNFQLGPSAGYAFTWAITKRFFVFMAISGGINIGFNDSFKDIMVYPSAIPRFSTGYNFRAWSINISYVNDLMYSYLSSSDKILLSSGTLQFSIYFRFNVNYDFLRNLPVLRKLPL